MGQSHADNRIRAASDLEPSLLDADGAHASFEVSLLGLSKVDRLGRKGIAALVRAYENDLGRVWREPPKHVQAILVKHNIPSSEAIAKEISTAAETRIREGEAEVRKLAANRVSVLPPAKMPPKLGSIPSPPPWLFVQGDVEALYRTPAVAVVGTRKPSERGRKATQLVVRQLSAYPILMVSGLAEGIDEEAHRTSLQEGVKNVAFLGHGINTYFPATTKALRDRVVQDGGAVASEYLPDEHYQKPYFVERNRLQAGIADLVMPVEARLGGGTAHTVRFAKTYGRPLAGVRWDRANGILEELENYDIFDVMTSGGKKRLDAMFRELARAYGHRTSSLALVERTLQRELQSRVVQRGDAELLSEWLDEFLEDELEDGDDD